MLSASEAASYFHSKILRIPHEGSNPTKRFLPEEQILKLFNGNVIVQEKVDGKLSFKEDEHLNTYYSQEYYENSFKLYSIEEDLSGKNTVHTHVKKYNRPPYSQRVPLDLVLVVEGYEPFILPYTDKKLNICMLRLDNPSLEEIYTHLQKIANRKSVYGDTKIEGLVIKKFGTYESIDIDAIIKNPHLYKSTRPTMAKYINTEFEDVLPK